MSYVYFKFQIHMIKYIIITTFQIFSISDMGSNTLVFEGLKLIAFLRYLILSSTFKYFYKYVVGINVSFSRSRVMHAKLITFTSPNSTNY